MIRDLKKNAVLLLQVLFLSFACVVTFSSCSDDVENPLPPAPFPTNELVDQSINPGDDFYNYCNGTWIKEHPLAPGVRANMFWTNEQYSNAMFQKKILESNDPVIKKLMQDMHTDGYQTSVEDVADLNGVNAALIAMVKHYKAKGASDEELLKAKREFFLGYANLWGGVFSYERIKAQMNDIHSISILRVNGIVRHIDEWYDVYNIKPTDKLYLAPADRVRIWNK